MSISELLNALKSNPDSLSISEKLLAGLSVAALSMAVVFVVLVIIAFSIQIMNPAPKAKKEETQKPEANTPMESASVEITEENNSQLVAVITAAIAATTSNNIVVRRIVRTNNIQSEWEKVK